MESQRSAIQVFARAAGVWLIMVIAAILNGLLRDTFLTPLAGRSVSLPLSGITLSILVFLVAYVAIPSIGVAHSRACFMLGMFWVTLTLAFEYLFGHYVAGKSWNDINQVFDVAGGDLFIVVLFVTALSPWLTAKLRGLI